MAAQRLNSGRASFGEVLETFRLGKALRTYASNQSLKELNWTLKECAVTGLLSAPSESMRAATKAEITECVSSVRELALSCSGAKVAANPPLPLLQELEQLELAISMKVCEEDGGGERLALQAWMGRRYFRCAVCRTGGRWASVRWKGGWRRWRQRWWRMLVAPPVIAAGPCC